MNSVIKKQMPNKVFNTQGKAWPKLLSKKSKKSENDDIDEKVEKMIGILEIPISQRKKCRKFVKKYHNLSVSEIINEYLNHLNSD